MPTFLALATINKIGINYVKLFILKNFFEYIFILTFGSNLVTDPVRKAARPSFITIAKPPIKGEYSISITYALSGAGNAIKIPFIFSKFTSDV